jgi:hypothetical protein
MALDDPSVRLPPASDNEALKRAKNDVSDKWTKLVTTTGGTTYVPRGDPNAGEIEKVHRGLGTFTSRTDLG